MKKTIGILSAIFLTVLIIANYNYHLLGEKIVPLEIPVDFNTLSRSSAESDNFASDDYDVQFIVKIPVYTKRSEFEKALKEFQDIQKDSGFKLTVFENETTEIYEQVFKLSQFNSRFGFAYRYIEKDYVTFTLDPSIYPANPDGAKKSEIEFQKNMKYRIDVHPLVKNEILKELSPAIIFFGVDDGYYGAGYIIYSLPILLIWLVLVISIIAGKSKRISNEESGDLPRNSSRKVVPIALLATWNGYLVLRWIVASKEGNEVANQWNNLIMPVVMIVSSLILILLFALFKYIFNLLSSRLEDN